MKFIGGDPVPMHDPLLGSGHVHLPYYVIGAKIKQVLQGQLLR